MPCPQTDLIVTPRTYINTDPRQGPVAISQPFQGQLTGNIPLMCSDNPETIDNLYVPSPTGDTLWLYPMTDAGPGPITHRVFSWHINQLPAPGVTMLGLTLENRNGFPLQVDVLREGGISPNALCIAKALLAGNYNNLGSVTVPPYTVGILDSNAWSPGDAFGAEYQLTITPKYGPYHGVSFQYNLREVHAPSVFFDLTSITSDPVPPDTRPNRNHPRGSWPQSELTTTCVLNIDGSFASTIDHYFPLLNGVPPPVPPDPNVASDDVFRVNNSVNQVAVNNSGAFGGIYRNIALQINNNTTRDYTFMVFLNPRGGRFLGAIQYSALDNGNVHGIPAFNTATDLTNSIVLPNLTVNRGTQVQRTMSLVVGGAASTPVALALRVI